jgi:hypothetical protein
MRFGNVNFSYGGEVEGGDNEGISGDLNTKLIRMFSPQSVVAAKEQLDMRTITSHSGEKLLLSGFCVSVQDKDDNHLCLRGDVWHEYHFLRPAIQISYSHCMNTKSEKNLFREWLMNYVHKLEWKYFNIAPAGDTTRSGYVLYSAVVVSAYQLSELKRDWEGEIFSLDELWTLHDMRPTPLNSHLLLTMTGRPTPIRL